MPSVTTFRMDFRVTRLTQRDKITLFVCSSLGQRQLVMHLFYRTKQTFPVALLTERVLGYIAVTDSFPRPAIPTAYSRVPVVLLVALVLLPLVFLTEPSFRKVGTAGKGTGALWFSWHLATSFLHKESPRRITPTKAPGSYAVFDAISIPRLKANIISQSGHHGFPNRSTVSFSTARFFRL